MHRGVVLACLLLLSGCWQADASNSSGGRSASSGGGNGGSAAGFGSPGGGSGGGGPECGELEWPLAADPLPPTPMIDAGSPLFDAAVSRGDAGSAATDAASVPADAASMPADAPRPDVDAAVARCDPDGGIAMPSHGALCDPARCRFTTFLNCAASCNTCSDGLPRWVTACGQVAPN